MVIYYEFFIELFKVKRGSVKGLFNFKRLFCFDLKLLLISLKLVGCGLLLLENVDYVTYFISF